MARLGDLWHEKRREIFDHDLEWIRWDRKISTKSSPLTTLAFVSRELRR
jgi:hypothetical protein